jgi:hypothetical protein
MHYRMSDSAPLYALIIMGGGLLTAFAVVALLVRAIL